MKQDLATKSLEAFPDVFADIGNVNLYDGEQVIVPEELEQLPSEMICQEPKGEQRELRADIRMRIKHSGTEIAIMSVENQAGICNTMPVRSMGYEYAGYMEQIRKIKERNRKKGENYYTKEIGDNQKLVPVISLVLYYGEEEWDSPLSLMDMFELSEEDRRRFETHIQNHSIQLVQLRKQDEEIQNKYRSDFRYVVQYLSCRSDKKKMLQKMKEDSGKLEHPKEFLDVMCAITKDQRYQQIREGLSTNIEKGEKINMCTIAEELENQGIQKGVRQGLERGMEQGILKINQLNAVLLADGRIEDLFRSTKDVELQKALMKEYGIM